MITPFLDSFAAGVPACITNAIPNPSLATAAFLFDVFKILRLNFDLVFVDGFHLFSRREN